MSKLHQLGGEFIDQDVTTPPYIPMPPAFAYSSFLKSLRHPPKDRARMPRPQKRHPTEICANTVDEQKKAVVDGFRLK